MELTGNPFVDTGLMVLAALARRGRVADLTFADVRAVYGDGENLARVNEGLKCFTMVFGTNGPLTQPAYKKTGKNREIYLSIVGQLLDFAETEGSVGPRCDLTGIQTDFNFHSVCAKALSGAGLPVPEKKYLGRDWVPLGGSLGNDAQALPVASRPLHVSALALFAFQYLPLGVRLFKGKLACLQCTQEDLAQSWVERNVEDVQNRIAVGDTEILGKGKGTGEAFVLLMGLYGDIAYEPGNEGLLWLFSNSGTGADCAVESVPEKALSFAYAASADFGSEIRKLVSSESKDSRQQLFECVRGERDYPGLYAFKKHLGASAELYELYQREIRGATAEQLAVARKLAALVIGDCDPKKLKEAQKPEFARSGEGRSFIQKIVVKHLSVAEYDALFPSTSHPIRSSSAGWELVRYYLTTPFPDTRLIDVSGLTMKTTHPKIVQIAETYRDTDPRKIKNLLDRMMQRKIGVRWLQDKFCQLAADHPDWTLGEWDEFVCDEDGRVITFELLFQIRLYLANLYREVIANGKGEAA